MSELLILEFENVGEADYNAVNADLGIDPGTGEGDWPAGLHTHTAGTTAGGLIVIEVWESQEDQDEFMKSRLGAALHKAGLPDPKRVEWSKVKGHHAPKKPSAKAK